MSIIIALWIAFAAYLLMAARGTRATEQAESIASRWSYLVPLIIGAGLCLGWGSRFSWLNVQLIARSRTSELTGLLLTIAGLALATWARWHLGALWSGRVTLKVDHQLVHSGPYAFLSHPMYVGLSIALLGAAISQGQVGSFAGFGIVCAAFWHKSRIENRMLAQRFSARA
jgi:protein-S-isoprenylcysteine O-methyltransferase Ste14